MSVFVCEPQSVGTDATRRGLCASVTSKMRIPSNAVGSVGSGVSWLSHPGEVCGRSTERKSRWPQTETSFWGPWQWTSATTTGAPGLEMSITRKPS